MQTLGVLLRPMGLPGGRIPKDPRWALGTAKPGPGAEGITAPAPHGGPVEQWRGRPLARIPAAPVGGQRRRGIHGGLTNARALILAAVHPWTPPALPGPIFEAVAGGFGCCHPFGP
jgi:hypothetical protein